MKTLLCLVTCASLLLARQDVPEWKRFEEKLRPPSLQKTEITLWPDSRPLKELTSAETPTLLEHFAKRPEDLELKSLTERAYVQRLLWAFFDAHVRSWNQVDPKRVDQGRPDGPLPKPVQEKPARVLEATAHIIRGLALTEAEIRSLPDSYAQTVKSGAYAKQFDPAKPDQPFLPADLWDPEGPWISLGNSKELPLAIRHTNYFGGRATFHIFLRVPEGRQAGRALVGTLREYSGQRPLDAPVLPAETQVAIVEQAILLTPEGKLVPAPVVDTVEIRVIHKPARRFRRQTEVQSVFRFRLRPELLSVPDSAPLKARTFEESDWEPVLELVEGGRDGAYNTRGSSLVHCSTCHSFAQAQTLGIFEMRSRETSGTLEAVAPERERERTIRWKENNLTWAELLAHWK